MNEDFGAENFGSRDGRELGVLIPVTPPRRLVEFSVDFHVLLQWIFRFLPHVREQFFVNKR